MAGVFISKNAGPEAARIAGGSVQMDAAAGKVRRAVIAAAAGHRDSGAYIRSLSIQTVPSVEPSRVGFVDDRIVVSTDPGALAIEYGHMQRFKGARRVRWVPGHAPMRRGLMMVH